MLVRQECTRLLRRSPARLALLVLYTALAVWAGIDGLHWKRALAQAQHDRPADLRQERSAWMADLERVLSSETSSPFEARPMNLTLLAVLPPGPLAELSHQRESIHPHTALISGWQSDASLFRRYEVEGSSALSMRGLDLTYLAVVLFPLVLLLSTFDVLSAERHTGRLRLLMVQGARPALLVLARLVTIAVPVWLVTSAVAVVVALVGQEADGNLGRLALWLAAFTGYAALWAAAAGWIAARCARSSDPAMAAMAAVTAWVVVVLLVPSFAQFAAEAVYPTPSRVAYLTQARQAEAQSRRELEQRAEVYMAEHDIHAGSADQAVPGFFRASYLANININSSTAPLVARFEEQRAAQAAVADRIELAAPTMLAYRILQDAAGVGAERAADYRRQVREHLKVLHEAVGPATVGRSRLTLDQARAIPDFRFVEPAVPSSAWWGVAWLLALAVGVGAMARRAARRVAPLDS
ncbi:MAG: DUF3526 domain-containing protein [Myxococcota bacterium]